MYTKYAKLRDERGYNDFAVCNELGIPPTTLSDWKKRTANWKEGEKKPNISFEYLEKIADLFKVSMDDFRE